MAQAPVVQAVGLKALARDLKRMGAPAGPLLKAMQQAGKIAGEPVLAMTRATLPQVGQGPHLVDTVRLSATRTGASIRMGNANVRWAGWVEFGGTRRRPHTSTRDYVSQGRYLYPAARALAPQVAERYEHLVTGALETFKWTNEATNEANVHD